MLEAILVVLSNAVTGREDEFNDWYTNIHLRDALRFRGSIASQRFGLSGEPIHGPAEGFSSRYLALYEVYDAQRFAREHAENALTTRMQISNSFDMSELNDFHYYLRQQRNNDPLSNECAGVILEQFKVSAERKGEFESWYNDSYLPEANRRPGVLRSAFLVYDPYGQLMTTTPGCSHVGIYHIKDAAAIDAWRESDVLATCTDIDQDSLAVSCWTPITPRITEDDVQHTAASALEAEQRARQRMGDKVITLRGDELKPE